MDQWLAGIRARPHRGVAGNRPPLAVDRCFDTLGNPIAAGPHVWDTEVTGGREPGDLTMSRVTVVVLLDCGQ